MARGFRSDLLAVAISELRDGVREVPDGSNSGPHIDGYCEMIAGRTRIPWCACFVCWCMRKAKVIGGYGLAIPSTASTIALQEWGKAQQREILSVDLLLPGDFWVKTRDKIDDDTESDHCGFVLSRKPNGMILTVEGNYSNRVASVERDPNELVLFSSDVALEVGAQVG